MTKTTLNDILTATRTRVAAEKERVPQQVLESAFNHVPQDFEALFKNDGLNVIAEIKRASPSRGDIFSEANPLEVAAEYLANEAAALSVLTEPEWFKGDLNFITQIRAAHPQAFLLMKEFVVDAYQLYQARALGADAVLLIVAALSQNDLKALYTKALELGFTPLVEVHNEEEMKRASDIGAQLIGVNSRNLKTMETSLQNLFDLAEKALEEATLIAESGIETNADMVALRQAGYDGFLIGSALMETKMPGAALKKLLEGS